MAIKHLLAASVLAAATAGTASAQDTGLSGLYFHGFVGGNYLGDADYTGLIGGSPNSVDTDYDFGGSIGGAIGWDINRWSTDKIGSRFEVSLSYANNDVDSTDFSGNGAGNEANTTGDTSTTALHANLLWDFKNSGRFTPYAGLGAGIAYVDQDITYGPGVRLNESDTVFSVQAIAGVSYALNNTTDLTLDARYSRAFDAETRRLNPAGVSTGDVQDDLENLSINVGVRFRF